MEVLLTKGGRTREREREEEEEEYEGGTIEGWQWRILVGPAREEPASMWPKIIENERSLEYKNS